MANVYVQPRPKGRPEGSVIQDYSVEDSAEHVIGGPFNTQAEAIEWAKRHGHNPLVPRVRHLNDKKRPDHWRSAINISYHAAQQMDRLSPRERNELQRALESGELQTEVLRNYSPVRFVSKFGTDKRVVWSRDNNGNIIILTVVAR